MVYCIILGFICAILFILMLIVYKLGTPLWVLCIACIIMITVTAYSMLNVALKWKEDSYGNLVNLNCIDGMFHILFSSRQKWVDI